MAAVASHHPGTAERQFGSPPPSPNRPATRVPSRASGTRRATGRYPPSRQKKLKRTTQDAKRFVGFLVEEEERWEINAKAPRGKGAKRERGESDTRRRRRGELEHGGTGSRRHGGGHGRPPCLCATVPPCLSLTVSTPQRATRSRLGTRRATRGRPPISTKETEAHDTRCKVICEFLGNRGGRREDPFPRAYLIYRANRRRNPGSPLHPLCQSPVPSASPTGKKR